MNYKEKFQFLKLKCGVYSFYDKDFKLLYIGKSYDLYSRIMNSGLYNLEAKYFSFIELKSELETDLAEIFLIKKLNPSQNKILTNKPSLLPLLNDFKLNKEFKFYHKIDFPQRSLKNWATFRVKRRKVTLFKNYTI